MAELLTQAAPKKEQLVDLLSEGTVALVESKKDGKIRVEGEFGRWDRATANKRFYPKGLWESNITRLRPELGNKKVLGELDHPDDGRTSLKRASHIITNLWLEKDGRVMGEAEIVPTRLGKDLEALFRSGVPVGISSRGYGSTKPNDKGEDVVQSDYKLVTFDFVAEPADNTAYPEAFFEGVEFPMNDEELAKKFADKVQGEKQASVSSSAASLRKEFEATLLSRLSDMKESVRAEVRAELLQDPEVAGAKTALEQIANIVRQLAVPADIQEAVASKDLKLQEQELQIREKDEVIEKLAKAAKASGYKFHMESLIAGDDQADLIRQCVGDVSEYDSAGHLAERIEEIRTEIEARREQERAQYEEVHAAEIQLKEQNEQLTGGLQEALTSNKQLALQLYAERQLRNHPGAAKIHAVLEHTGVTSRDQIDALIEEFREIEDEETMTSIRDRVRILTGGGRSHVAEEAHRPRQRVTEKQDYQNLGAPLGELKKLAGLGSGERRG